MGLIAVRVVTSDRRGACLKGTCLHLAHKNQQEMLALGPSRAQFGGLILRTQTMFCQKGTMTKASFVSVLSFLAALGLSSAASAQARDPLTKFIDNLFKRDAVE